MLGRVDLLSGISRRDNVDPGEGWHSAGSLRLNHFAGRGGEGGGRDRGTSRAVGFPGFTVEGCNAERSNAFSGAFSAVFSQDSPVPPRNLVAVQPAELNTAPFSFEQNASSSGYETPCFILGP